MGTSKKSDFSKLFLLPAYVLFETVRAVLTYAAIQSGVPISSTLVTLCSELIKFIFTIAFLLRYISFVHGEISFSSFLAEIHTIVDVGEENAGVKTYIKSYVKYMIPSLLYLINNILYLLALHLTTPALLHITILAKLPITAVAHHFIIQPQRNGLTWASLGALCIGLILTNIPPGFSQWLLNGTKDGDAPLQMGNESFFGIIVGLLVACTSGFTSIYMEIVMKQRVSFWVAQFWLYAFGSLFAGMTYSVWDGRSTKLTGHLPTLDGEASPFLQSVTVIAVIIITAATGLCVANILRKKDNLVKLIGTSTSMVTIIIVQTILYPQLRYKTFTMQTVFGVGVISISTWTYNYYKQQLPAQDKKTYSSISLGDQDEEDDGNLPETENKMASKSTAEDNGTLVPTPKRLLACIILVLCLTAWTAQYAPQTTPVQNQDPQLSNSTEQVPIPEPVSLLYANPVGVDDVKRFFDPHNISPTEWGNTETPITCVESWVDRYAQPTSANFTDWETSFIHSGCPIYPIPQGGMIFHQFWSGPWRPFNEISIEAWLATQRLGDGHRLVYWYTGAGPTPEVRERFTTGEYGKYVEFREFDPAEAEGFCIADMPEWNNEAYIEANGMNVASMSDIIRNFLLAKFGGVWLDSDTIPVRDMTPMIRSGPSAGALNEHDWNNNLLVFGPPNTNVTKRVLEATCSLSSNKTLYLERNGPDAIMPSHWYWLWNDGLFKTCAAKTNCGVSRLPVFFNDGYCWFGKGQSAMLPCEPDNDIYIPDTQPVPTTMHTIFTWHTRWGHYDDACVDINRPSLTGAVRRRIRELLDLGLDMDGRDLFPGPALLQ